MRAYCEVLPYVMTLEDIHEGLHFCKACLRNWGSVFKSVMLVFLNHLIDQEKNCITSLNPYKVGLYYVYAIFILD